MVPLWKSTAALLEAWLKTIEHKAESPLFPNRHGDFPTRSGIAYRLDLAVKQAARTCPSISTRGVSPHTLRHTTAMHLLQSGVDVTVVALWLGHESPETTHLYVQADLAMKRAAIERVEAASGRRRRFAPGDKILAFLDGL